jgi:hypothetical protein
MRRGRRFVKRRRVAATRGDREAYLRELASAPICASPPRKRQISPRITAWLAAELASDGEVQLVMIGPTDGAALPAQWGLFASLPIVVGWIAVLLATIIGRARVAGVHHVVAVTAPYLAVLVPLLARLRALRELPLDPSIPGLSIQPMIRIASLGPGASELRWGVATALILWIAFALVGWRSRMPGRGRRSKSES